MSNTRIKESKMPKRHRNATDNTNRLTVASWNVLSICSNPSMENLNATLRGSHITIAALQSTRRHGPDKFNFFFSDANAHEGGMAIWTTPQYAPLTQITFRHPRVMVALISTPTPLLLVNFYAPTTFSAPFWELLDTTITQVQQQLDGREHIILCGDANAHISLKDSTFATSHPTNFPAETNANGEQLLLLCEKYNVSPANYHPRNSNKPWKHMKTFTQTTPPHASSLIDYICIPAQLLCEHPLRTSQPREFFSDHKCLELELNLLPAQRTHHKHRSRTTKTHTLPTCPTHQQQIDELNDAITNIRSTQPTPQKKPSIKYHPPRQVLLAHKALSLALISTRGAHTRRVTRLKTRFILLDKVARKQHHTALIRHITSNALLFQHTRIILRPKAFRKRNSHTMTVQKIQRELAERITEKRTRDTHTPIKHFETYPPPQPQQRISIYTDGSFFPRTATTPALGGWAFTALHENNQVSIHCGHIENCRSAYHSEVYATMRALQEYPHHEITLFTDCLAVLHTLNSLHTQTLNNYSNLDSYQLWRQIAHSLTISSLTVEKVPSHSQILPNELCDTSAKFGAHQTTEHLTHTMICPLHQSTIPFHLFTPGPEPPPLFTGKPSFRHPHDTAPTNAEIHKALNKIRPSAARGIDTISPPELKDYTTFPHFAALLRQCWHSKSLPECWQQAKLVGIPKKGGGHRGITVLNCAYKVMANIINSRLQQLPMLRHQLGFVKGRSTHVGILYINNFIRRCNNKGQEGHIAFIDLHQAFDNIHRDTLIATLTAFGIGEHTTAMISALLTDAIFTSADGTTLSTAFPSTKGVKQGCPLSPTLFTLCLESAFAASQLQGCSLIAFADDILVTAHDAQSLRNGLRSLEAQLLLFGLTINFPKSAYMRCGTTNPHLLSRDSKEGNSSRSAKRAIARLRTRGPHTVRQVGYYEHSRIAYLPSYTPAAIACPFSECTCVISGGRSRASSFRRHCLSAHGVRIQIKSTECPRLQPPARDPMPRFTRNAPKQPPDLTPLLLSQLHAPIPATLTYNYLGAIISPTGSQRENAAKRCAAATLRNNLLAPLWKSDISLALRRNLFHKCVLPVLLYGHETWCLSRKTRTQITTCLHNLCRKAARTPAVFDPITQTYAKGSATTARQLLNCPPLDTLLTRGRLRLLGTLIRNQPYLPVLHLHKDASHAKRGPAEHSWMHLIHQDLSKHHLSSDVAFNRSQWKRHITNLN